MARMGIEDARVFIGPVMQLANILAIFLCLRPKRGTLFTLCALAVYSLAVHGVIQVVAMLAGTVTAFLGSLIGLLFLPVYIWLFRGQVFQKVFAFFITFQITGMIASFADMLVGMGIGFQNPHAQIILLVLSLLFLGAEMLLLWLFGRRLFERVFVEGSRVKWALYALGAAFSSTLVALSQWRVSGAALYTGLMLFVLWSIAVLCFTIINTHEKAAQEHLAQILRLQMDTLRNQIDAEKKHRANMAILRHDMRHEAGVIAELFRAGKAAQAEAVYAQWQASLARAEPEPISR